MFITVRRDSGQDFAIPFHDRVVVSAVVRVHAAAAVFVPVFKIFEISAASVAEHVERAVAEQAVEVIFVAIPSANALTLLPSVP